MLFEYFLGSNDNIFFYSSTEIEGSSLTEQIFFSSHES